MLVVIALTLPALAVTNGTPDTDEQFPAVGQLLFFDPAATDPRFEHPGGWFNCTGTLLSDTVVLTAGHCTFGIGEGGGANADGDGGTDVWVNFEFAPDYSILPPSSGFAPGNNAGRYVAWEAALDGHADWRRGTAHPHPDYVDAAFFLFDVGIVVLDDPVPFSVHEGDFGELPDVGYINQFLTKKGPDQRFVPVGYGIQEVVPDFMSVDERYYGEVKLIDGNGVFGVPKGVSVKFSNHGGKNASGGTCFGDSGGPVFEAGTRIIAAVTSFGINNNCVGTGGGYRIDKAVDLAWIESFLD
jgi:hypothetical protein